MPLMSVVTALPSTHSETSPRRTKTPIAPLPSTVPANKSFSESVSAIDAVSEPAA